MEGHQGDRPQGDQKPGVAVTWDDRERLWEKVSRPERPEMSDTTPPPVLGIASMPRALRRAQAMWYVALATLFFAAVTMILIRSTLASTLVAMVKDQDPTIADWRVADYAPVAIYAIIGALVLMAVPEWGFASLLSARRHWPRIVMIPLSLLHVAVAGGCLLLVPFEVWQGWLLLGALVVGAGVAVAANIPAFAPSVTRWIRSRDEDLKQA